MMRELAKLIILVLLFTKQLGMSVDTSRCSCVACLQPSSNVHLLQTARGDGMGSTMTHIVLGMAYCFHHGWFYGGVSKFRARPTKYSHNVDLVRFFDFFFGNRSYVDGSNLLSKVAGMEKGKIVTIANYSTLESVAAALPSSFPDNKLTVLNYLPDRFPYNMSRYVSSPSFLSALRMTARCGVSKQLSRSNYYVKQPQRLRVALHIRIGDVWADEDNAFRLTHLTWYVKVVEGIQSLYPDSQFHVFSSFLGKANYTRHPGSILTETLTILKNVTLHIDDEDSKDATTDTLTAMSHLITADVLVMAKSCFSYVSAVLNSRCVVHTPFWFEPLTQWPVVPPPPSDSMNDDDVRALNSFLQSDLRECIQNLPDPLH